MVFASALQIWHSRLIFQSLSLSILARVSLYTQALYLYILSTLLIFQIVCCEGQFHFSSFPLVCGEGDELAVLWSGEVEFALCVIVVLYIFVGLVLFFRLLLPMDWSAI